MSGLSQMAGRVRSALGWATADRREEAKGKLVELDSSGDQPTAADGSTAANDHGDEEQAIDDAELAVRGDHGDLTPDTEEQARPPQMPPTPG